MASNADENEDLIDLTFPRKKRIILDFTEGRFEKKIDSAEDSFSSDGGIVEIDSKKAEEKNVIDENKILNLDEEKKKKEKLIIITDNHKNSCEHDSKHDSILSCRDDSINDSCNDDDSKVKNNNNEKLNENLLSFQEACPYVPENDTYRGGVTVCGLFRGEVVKCSKDTAGRSQRFTGPGSRGSDKVSLY